MTRRAEYHADYFSGPSRALGRVCVCVRTTEMTLDLAIWHDGSY